MCYRIMVGIALIMLIGMQPADAIVITLDEPSPTVVRPVTGTTEVNFTGRIEIADGFEPGTIQGSTLFNENGDRLDVGFPMPRFDSGRFNVAGVLFSVLVSATDSLGLYSFGNFELKTPVFLRYFECPIGSITGCNSSTVNYSLNIVAAAGVPEPSMPALIGMGILALLLVTRRPSRQRVTQEQRQRN
jgi:hypothetical protein